MVAYCVGLQFESQPGRTIHKINRARVKLKSKRWQEIRLDKKKYNLMGSDCGTAGRAVSFDTRGPGFKSINQQFLRKFILHLTVEDLNIKKKRPRTAHIKNKQLKH